MEKAKRDITKPYYDNIPLSALRRVANIYKEGALKYGMDNWRQTVDEDYARDVFNHLMEHLFAFSEIIFHNSVPYDIDIFEDHLGHALWGVLALCEYQERGDIDQFPTKEQVEDAIENFNPLKEDKEEEEVEEVKEEVNYKDKILSLIGFKKEE